MEESKDQVMEFTFLALVSPGQTPFWIGAAIVASIILGASWLNARLRYRSALVVVARQQLHEAYREAIASLTDIIGTAAVTPDRPVKADRVAAALYLLQIYLPRDRAVEDLSYKLPLIGADRQRTFYEELRESIVRIASRDARLR